METWHFHEIYGAFVFSLVFGVWLSLSNPVKTPTIKFWNHGCACCCWFILYFTKLFLGERLIAQWKSPYSAYRRSLACPGRTEKKNLCLKPWRTASGYCGENTKLNRLQHSISKFLGPPPPWFHELIFIVPHTIQSKALFRKSVCSTHEMGWWHNKTQNINN